jgi:uncharacterized repeat protein (TIGR02543 family)
MKKLNYLFCILMLFIAVAASGQEKHLYIAFGQSNMRGPGPIRDKDKENIPENLQVLNVMTGEYGGIRREKGQWYKAVPPLIIRGNLNHYTGQFTIGLSPADWFGRTMYAKKPDYVSHIGIIPVGGGSLALGAYHKDWGTSRYFASGSGGAYRDNARPDNTERTEGYNMYVTESGYASLYDAIISNARKAQSDGWIVKGIIVHQGESGRGLNYASWGNILKDIYDDMLSDLGLEPNSIPILCGQTFNGGSGQTDGTLASDDAIRKFIPNAHIISSSGCAGRPVNDNTHFGSEGQELLGTRYGEKMAELVYTGNPLPGFALSTSASPSGGGSVTVSPALSTGRYDEGATVTLTAEPAGGWKFDGWSGDATGSESPLTITMDADKSITAKFLPVVTGGENLIANGNFIGTQDWTIQNGSATWEAAGGKATIFVPVIGENPWEPQLIQKSIMLENGMKYRFSFEASATAEKKMEVMFQQSGDPYEAYFNTGNLDLTTEMQPFTFDFEMTNPSDANTQLAFNLGTSTAGVILSNVELISLSTTGTDKISSKEANLHVTTLPDSAVKVNFTATGSSKTDLMLYGINGNLVASAKVQAIAGENCSYTFDRRKLPSGFYIVQARSNGGIEQAKVVVP